MYRMWLADTPVRVSDHCGQANVLCRVSQSHPLVWKSLTNHIHSISIKVTNCIHSISINQTSECDWPIWANKNNKSTAERSLTFEILNQKVGFSKKRSKKFIERARDQLFPPKNIRRRDVRARLFSFLSFAFVVFLSVYIFQPWRECRSLDVSAMGIWCLTTLEKRTRFSRGIRSSRTRSLVNLPKR